MCPSMWSLIDCGTSNVWSEIVGGWPHQVVPVAGLTQLFFDWALFSPLSWAAEQLIRHFALPMTSLQVRANMALVSPGRIHAL